MEWIERLNRAMEYLECHLTEEISYEELGRIACCSAYHFQRMFGYLADVSLAEYIRRRRMSLAAVDLQSGDEKIIDLSLKYGYTSPTAFNRAFQSVHGMTPSAARREKLPVTSYPPIHFTISVKGAEAMHYRMEEKEAFRIVGISHPLHREIEKNFTMVPKLWNQAVQDGIIAQLVSVMDGEPGGILGVSACEDQENWRYYIAAASSMEVEEPLEEYLVPACTWAVFSGEGTGRSIQELEQRIVTEWLPASGYEFADGPDLEVYFDPNPEHTAYEVWIPVKKC